jgi:hypothetical protein
MRPQRPRSKGYEGTMLRTRLLHLTQALSRLTNQLLDLTYPYTAMFTGRRFNQCVATEAVAGREVSHSRAWAAGPLNGSSAIG